MSAPSLSDHLALVAAEPALAGHPVVAELVVAVDQLAIELASLREENAERRRQLARPSGNSGQPGHAGTTRVPVTPAQVAVGVEHWPHRCGQCDAALPRVEAGPAARRQVHDLPGPPPRPQWPDRCSSVRA